jgi:hypothetical protein
LGQGIQSSIYGHKPSIGWDSGESLAEHVLSTIDVDETWPATVRRWHAEASQWIPPHVFAWWMDQFDSEGKLHTMAPQWWQCRAHRFVAALADGEPVGGVALAPVHFGDRGIDNITADRKHLFYELRGLAVDPRHRRTAAKVGTHLVSTLVQDASRAQETPTFAITNNPNAARIFASTGASADCDHMLFRHLAADVLQGVVCWCAPRADPLCDECPVRPEQLWWWPAD